ncbi:MAG: hypothetical protein U0359_06445 [Byssovorax sp.]
MAEKPLEDVLLIPLPGGRVARVPLTALEPFVDTRAKLAHGADDGGGDDVSAHSMTIDPTTGASTWHTEWELGHCDYTDESGYPRAAYVWHRHPLGTEYTEIYQK